MNSYLEDKGNKFSRETDFGMTNSKVICKGEHSFLAGDSWIGISRRTIHHLLGRHRRRKSWALFLYCGLMDVQHDRHLVHPFQVRGFFLSGLATNHSHIANVQRELVTPASISPAPPVSSPSPDANGENELQVFDASDYSTLQVLRVDRMQNGESKEF